MSVFEYTQYYLEYHYSCETLRIMSWGPNSLRVVSVPNGPLDLSASALLPQDPVPCQIQIQEGCATITNGKITAVLSCQPEGPAILSFYNDHKKLLLQEIPRGGALVKKARCFVPNAGGNYRLTTSFLANEGEKIYGMGQYQQDILDLKGCYLELAHRNTQASVPFYISSLGYGFFWHNPAIGDVFFGKNVTQWTSRSTKKLDYWITAGPTPAVLEEQYSLVTGRAPIMPDYALGYWQCKLRYSSQEEVLKIAREYHKRQIPLSVLVIDFYHWKKCGDYCFDRDFFPAPEEMVRELRSYGIEPMVSIWPQIDTENENYPEMDQQGLLVQNEHGMNLQMLFHGNNVFYDATNPTARQYIWDKCHKNYYEKGIRLFWLDEAEPEFGTYDYENYRYYIGSVLETGNVYPREYARGFYEGLKESGEKEIINLVRCAWAGSQRYASLVWSGDIHSTYEDFRKQITAGLQMGLAGIPWWTTDIGGFNGGQADDPAFQQLLIRWFQFGTFCPVMRMHGNRLPRTPIFLPNGQETEGTGAPNEIWSYGEANYQIMKKYIMIREAMKEYTKGLMLQAHETGAPVIRPLFYQFPEDPTAWDIKYEYMYGPDLLIAPVTLENVTSVQIYLPGCCTWTEAHTGRQYAGGQTVCAEAPLETIPVFLRDGHQSYLLGKI